MIDHDEIKVGVLQDLIDHMKSLQGERMRPKAVEVSVEHEPALELQGKTDEIQPEHEQGEEHAEPDGDELSPEDVAVIEQMLGGEKDEG